MLYEVITGEQAGDGDPLRADIAIREQHQRVAVRDRGVHPGAQRFNRARQRVTDWTGDGDRGRAQARDIEPADRLPLRRGEHRRVEPQLTAVRRRILKQVAAAPDVAGQGGDQGLV